MNDLRRCVTMILLAVSFVSHAQSQAENDSIVDVICRTIMATPDLPDSVRIFSAYRKHLDPYLYRHRADSVDEIIDNIYFRLQRNCPEFRKILERDNEQGGDWDVTLEGKPKGLLGRAACRAFGSHHWFTYRESTGDTVSLEIQNGYWIDHFKDGTYSKLSFRWVSPCEFEITFIESNNRIRKNFSKAGDRYRYMILDQKDNYYLMSVVIVGLDHYESFKLYY